MFQKASYEIGGQVIMSKVIVTSVFIGIILFTYYEIREILWSIVWAEIGGKYRKLIQYKRIIKKQQSVMNRISMQYLTNTLVSNKQDFIFWRRMKLLFAVFELLVLVLYIIYTVYMRHFDFGYPEDLILMIQTFVCFLIVRLQFREGKYTKYDYKRMKKK